MSTRRRCAATSTSPPFAVDSSTSPAASSGSPTDLPRTPSSGTRRSPHTTSISPIPASDWDFVEAPSQMLEEWAWDADVLRTFARNATGEQIPAELVHKMRRADDFGKGYNARTQMFYASMSYWFHVDIPDDLTERTRELQTRYSLFPYIE